MVNLESATNNFRIDTPLWLYNNRLNFYISIDIFQSAETLTIDLVKFWNKANPKKYTIRCIKWKVNDYLPFCMYEYYLLQLQWVHILHSLIVYSSTTNKGNEVIEGYASPSLVKWYATIVYERTCNRKIQQKKIGLGI